jgi:hypothetical protein
MITEYKTVCVALIRPDLSTAASSCNDGANALGSAGLITLQRVVPGSYRAIAWRVATPDLAVVIGQINVPQEGQLPFLGFSQNYAAGLNNYAGQTLEPLPFVNVSPTNSAVIIP